MRIFVIVLAICFSCVTNASQINYTFKVDESLTLAQVNVCFVSEVPKALYNGQWRYNRWLRFAMGPQSEPLDIDGNMMSLAGVKSGECIDYEVNLGQSKGRRRSLHRAGSDIIFSNHMWLWQPKDIRPQDKVLIKFDLPKGFGVSVPWKDTDAKDVFSLTQTPYDWRSRSAIGKFKVTKVAIGKQHLRVAVLDSTSKRKKEYLDWIKQSASAVAGVGGRYPVDNAQIIITPIGAKREAVPWGEVQRGGNVAAHFFVDSFMPIQQFKDDWTATHELSHMLVPYIDRDELYLSEGMASYYQNVARAKASMISPQTGWDKLLAGFGRGTRSAKRESLSNSSGIMQMYWGGAAIYLMADQALRQRSNGKESLGTVLARFHQCCRPNSRSWSGLALMKKYDELSKSKIFTTLYFEQAQQRRFPDVVPVLKTLGIKGLKRDKSKALSPSALAIMQN